MKTSRLFSFLGLLAGVTLLAFLAVALPGCKGGKDDNDSSKKVKTSTRIRKVARIITR